MQKFNQFLSEEAFLQDESIALLEKLITFGGKAYPKFGNIVIMAGGAGSGKGFIINKLVGIEGKTLDVDALKLLSAKSPMIRKKVKDELGLDIEAIAADLRNSDNVFKLHDIIANFLKIDSNREKILFTGILGAAPDRKPNIIFDTTLKSFDKLEKLASDAAKLGYDKKNVHIVWVVNDIEVAKKQNAGRKRVVPAEILVNTHRGAANTMGDIINMGSKLKKYIDGDIVFAFNKVSVDSELVQSGKGGSYVKEAEYVYVKRSGKAPTSVDKLDADLRRKIASYVPKDIDWG